MESWEEFQQRHCLLINYLLATSSFYFCQTRLTPKSLVVHTNSVAKARPNFMIKFSGEKTLHQEKRKIYAHLMP